MQNQIKLAKQQQPPKIVKIENLNSISKYYSAQNNFRY